MSQQGERCRRALRAVGGATALAAVACAFEPPARSGPDQAAPGFDPKRVFVEPRESEVPPIERWRARGAAAVVLGVDDDGGAVVRIDAAPGAGARTWPVARPDFAQADDLELHVRSPTAGPLSPVVLELAFFDDVRGTRWWQSVVLDDADWQVLSLPLSGLRYDRGVIPRWEDVGSWGVLFPRGGALEVRQLELWQHRQASRPHLGIEELRGAFPHAGPLRQAERGSFVVLTDAAGLDLEAVLQALQALEDRLSTRFPTLQRPRHPVPLLVFATDAGYRAFWRSFGTRAGLRSQPLAADDGFTWLGVATASFSQEFGAVRPVYVHEASHAWLERALGVDAGRSWLFEGLAVVDQLEVSGQDLAPLYQQALLRSDTKMPLLGLVSGRAIPQSRYWQAALVVEWILADAGRTKALADALVDMQAFGSTDLRPLLHPHFGWGDAQFSAEFWAWAWHTYAGASGA